MTGSHGQVARDLALVERPAAGDHGRRRRGRGRRSRRARVRAPEASAGRLEPGRRLRCARAAAEEKPETAQGHDRRLADVRVQRRAHPLLPDDKVKPPFDSSDWSFQAGKLLEFSPIIVNDVLYFQDIEAKVYALNAKNGQGPLEERDRGAERASSLAYAQHRLFVTNLEPGQAVALRPRDGKVLWRTPLPGRSESSPLAFKDKLVIFGCECGTVFALDQKDGHDQVDGRDGRRDQGRARAGVGQRLRRQLRRRALLDRRRDRATRSGASTRSAAASAAAAASTRRRRSRSAACTSDRIDSRVYSVDMDNGDIAWSKSTGRRGLFGPGGRRHDPAPAPPSTSAPPTTTSTPSTRRPARSAGSRTRAAR